MGILILLIFIGLGVGLWLIRRGASKAGASGHDRDRAVIADTPQTRAAIERWAQAHGYKQVANEAGTVRYQKGDGIKGQPTFLEARPGEAGLSIESWVTSQTFTRKPGSEMALAAPGIILAIPRKLAKRDHNVLRAELGLPPIG